MALLLKIFAVMGSIFAIAGATVVFYIYMKKMKDTKQVGKSGVWVNNYLSRFTQGDSFGWEKDVLQHPSGRLICTFYSLRDRKNPEERMVVIGKGMRVVTDSGDVKKADYLPMNINELPDELRNTSIGLMKSNYIEKQKADNIIFEIMKQKDITVEKVAREHAKSPITDDLLEKLSSMQNKQEEKKD